ncbi:protein MODIFYING WALL LIGNIN-1-like [Musa acuminata AAA Group]|uniref:protein MODIFYING WALL LIGNIN-1-like n=1 Tax=Musa acuminata AAA Group TaxID=214697 RepID=UPI0031E402A7
MILYGLSRDPMETPKYDELVICTIVALMGVVAFSCCVAAEFEKVKVKDMRLDGSLCSLPRSSAFGLGIAALVCLSIAQVIGTTMGGSRICSIKAAASSSRIASIALLCLAWIIYALASIILAIASSMDGGQSYGKGWMNGDCYIVHDGVYAGAAVMVVSIVLVILAFNFKTRKTMRHRTRLDEEGTIPIGNSQQSCTIVGRVKADEWW